MRFREYLLEVKNVGYQSVKGMFGPVFHGTTPENMQNILKNGFNSTNKRNGYEFAPYANGLPPAPMDHLGKGYYFTTNKTIAKIYNGNTIKGLVPFYLDVPRLETINFGATNTMYKWWRKQGYDMPTMQEMEQKGMSPEQMQQQWKISTQNLTDTLRSKYDAVWFKGKSMYKLLDGDQICVFDASRIHRFDPTLNSENEYHVGDRVKIKGIPAAVVITGEREVDNINNPYDKLFGVKSNHYYEVKGLKGVSTYLHQEYFNKLCDIVKNDSEHQQYIKAISDGRNIPIEDAIKQVAERYTQEYSLRNNFPESLIEKKVAKGMRV